MSVLSYAEIHYRPRFIPSAVFRRQPEVISDIPRRIEPESPLPVCILIKDADRFPIVLEAVIVHITYPEGRERIARFPYQNEKIVSPVWWDVINIMPEYTGTALIDVYIQVVSGKQRKLIRIDNYHDTTHMPFTVHIAESPLPGGEGWYHGDIHCHTMYTADQIEFGAPLEMTAVAAYALGLRWIAVTDHSYDLDDREGSYADRDPFLRKWWLMRGESELLSRSLILIPGEEVTCRTKNGLNCHMLSLNSDTFIHGSGDSGERGLDTRTEKSVGEAVSACVEGGGIACAAHPFERIPIFERMLLKRGPWTKEDLETPGIVGMQFYNGIRDAGFRAGKEMWIKFLLSGRKMYAFGGSDAHGDFNRFRGIGVPFWSVVESPRFTFGSVRTVVHADVLSRDSIFQSLGAGHAVVTDGPFIDLAVHSGETRAIPGDTCGHGEVTVELSCTSSTEFGPLKHCRLVGGLFTKNTERTLASMDSKDDRIFIENTRPIDTTNLRYLRAECETAQGNVCFTNPVWVSGN
ncbi:CehA/McbA family metallohydrolase [Candidatus Latescibacterota bacterium]